MLCTFSVRFGFMSKVDEIATLVQRFGPRYTRLITDVINMLEWKEGLWGLGSPVDRRALISHIIISELSSQLPN